MSSTQSSAQLHPVAESFNKLVTFLDIANQKGSFSLPQSAEVLDSIRVVGGFVQQVLQSLSTQQPQAQQAQTAVASSQVQTRVIE